MRSICRDRSSREIVNLRFPRFAARLAVAAIAGASGIGPAFAAEVLGDKPATASIAYDAIPNDQAIDRRIWVPGIDDGYVPQGMAWGDGAIYLSAYLGTHPRGSRGACRVFRMDPADGAVTGSFDLPADCGHAGGLALSGRERLVVADTHRLTLLDLAAAFTPESRARAVISSVALGSGLSAAFIDFDGEQLFIGTHARNPEGSKGYFLPLSIFETHRDGTVEASAVTRALSLPTHAQGAAFDRAGSLWISASNSRFGRLYRLNRDSGRIVARYPMPIGIEDLAFDDEGRLWSVSEAGALRWRSWPVSLPILFRIVPARLREDGGMEGE